MPRRRVMCEGCGRRKESPAGETRCLACLEDSDPVRRAGHEAAAIYEHLLAAAKAGRGRRGDRLLVAAEWDLARLCRQYGTIRTELWWYTHDGVGGIVRRRAVGLCQRPDGPPPSRPTRAYHAQVSSGREDSVLEFLGATEGMEVAWS